MKEERKAARRRLKGATRAEYDALVEAANLTPFQRKILGMHICHDSSINKIAMELFCCEATVRKHIAQIYDKIAKM